MVESDILRLLFGPDGMRQRVVTGLQFPAEKFQLRKYFQPSSDSLHNGLGQLIKILPLALIILLFV